MGNIKHEVWASSYIIAGHINITCYLQYNLLAVASSLQFSVLVVFVKVVVWLKGVVYHMASYQWPFKFQETKQACK